MTDFFKSLPKMSGVRKFTNLDRGPSAEPTVPVVPDIEEQKRISRLDAAKKAKRGGRASTILMEPPSDTVGP